MDADGDPRASATSARSADDHPDRRRPDAVLGCVGACVQAPDQGPHHPRRRGLAVVRHLPRHGARLGSPVRRESNCGRRRLDHARRGGRPHEPGHWQFPGFLGNNPFLDHYLTPFLVDEHDPNDPKDDEYSCDPNGTSGDWWAASGDGFDWEPWTFDLGSPASTPSTSRSRSRMQVMTRSIPWRHTRQPGRLDR